MRSHMDFFHVRYTPGLVFVFGLLQAPISSNLSGFWPLSNCSPSRVCKLLNAILLPVKAGNGTKQILTTGVPSPLDDKRRSIAVTFSPLPQTNENRLKHGDNLNIINRIDQASQDSGNVPFKKAENMPYYASSAIILFFKLCSFSKLCQKSC